MKLRIWISALRLRTLPLSISGILVGMSLASVQLEYLGNSNGFWIVFCLAILTTVLFQILSNLSNDYADFDKGTDNDKRVGPKRAVQSGEITSLQMKKASYLVVVIAFCSACSLVFLAKPYLTIQAQLVFIVLAILSILAAITYTVGKRAYGYRGLGDVMVFLFFGVLSVVGSYCLFGFPVEMVVLFFACAIGFWSTAVLNLNNLRDAENDQIVGKKTIVVQLGYKRALFYHFSLILLGYLFWFLALYILVDWSGFYAFFLCMIPSVFLFGHLRRVFRCEKPEALNKELGKVALITFFSSAMLFACLRVFVFLSNNT